MQVLSDAIAAFSEATARPDELFAEVARRTAVALGTGCGFTLLEPDGVHLRPVSHYSHDPDARALFAELINDRPWAATGAFGAALASGEPLRVPTATAELIRARFDRPDDRARFEAMGPGPVLFVPLRAQARAIGGLMLFRHGAGAPPFTDDDVACARSLAGHAAIAVANAQLLTDLGRALERSQRLGERLRTLAEFARELAGALGSYTRLLDLVTRRVGELIGGLCALRMVSTEGDWLESIGSVHHPDPALAAAARALMLSTPTRVGEGMAGRVVATGRNVRSSGPPGLSGTVDPRYRSFLERFPVSNVVAVPLFSDGRVIGVLSLGRAGDPPYTADDEAWLEDLAAHAALALGNSRLIADGRADHEQRVRTEEILRVGFLEAAPDAVVIVDPQGHVMVVNAQAETLFGARRVELIGQPITALVPGGLPVDRDHLSAAAVRRDGTAFTAEISLRSIASGDGVMLAATLRDATERRRELEEQNRRVAEASRLKSEFLANLSHELRTPLNAIIGFASFMHDGQAGPIAADHREYLGDILTSSRHLLQLIDDVLDLAKIEAGRLAPRRELVDLARVGAEASHVVRGLAAARGVQLTVETDDTLPPISADPRLLKQILYNFLSNAIKFTPSGGRVTLRIAAAGPEHVRLEVEDTGIGIKPDDLDRLFVEFQQLHHDATRTHPGTGLGLALTKRIVEALGGCVSAVSRVGQGSTFTAVLPRSSREEA